MPQLCAFRLYLLTIRAFKWGIVNLCILYTFCENWRNLIWSKIARLVIYELQCIYLCSRCNFWSLDPHGTPEGLYFMYCYRNNQAFISHSGNVGYCQKSICVTLWRQLANSYKGTSINDVSSNFGFLDPPPSPCRPSFSPKNRLKMPFLTPPSLPLKGDVVYGWSLRGKVLFTKSTPNYHSNQWPVDGLFTIMA